jgi:hypothetical protein
MKLQIAAIRIPVQRPVFRAPQPVVSARDFGLPHRPEGSARPNWESLWAQPIYDLIGAAIPKYDVLPPGRDGKLGATSEN